MRNLKRALSLAVASVMLLGMMVVGTGAAYDDVKAEHNVEAIEVLQLVGVMKGDDKGNFNPEKGVTRNEMAVIMVNLLDLDTEDYEGTSPFTDVPAWAEPFVAACYANGIVSGTSATTYHGDLGVKAVDAGLMIMKALKYFQFASDFENDYQMAAAKQADKIDLFDGVKVAPTKEINRNQVAQLVFNALDCKVVDYTGAEGTTVTGDGFTVITGSTINYFETAKTLADELYGEDLVKYEDKTDALGRPAVKWEYKDEDILVTEKADKVIIADGTDELADILEDEDLELADEVTYSMQGIVDGELEDKVPAGYVVELFLNDDKDVEDVVMYAYQMVEVDVVDEFEDDEDIYKDHKTTKQYDLGLGYTYYDVAKDLKGDDKNNVQAIGDFEDGDLLAVVEDLEPASASAKQIVELVKVESFDGVLTSYKNNTAKIGGESYIFADGAIVTDEFEDTYTFYQDPNGVIIDSELKEEADEVAEFVYVLGSDAQFEEDNLLSTKTDKAVVKVLYLDGTVETVEYKLTKATKDYDTNDDDVVDIEKGDMYFEFLGSKVKFEEGNFSIDKKWYSFEKADGKIELDVAKDEDGDGDVVAEVKNVTVVEKGREVVDGLYANNTTKVVLLSKDGVEKTYVGYKNFPEEAKTGEALVKVDDTTVKEIYFFVTEVDDEVEDYSIAMFSAAGDTSKDGVEYTFYVDGKKTTYVLDEADYTKGELYVIYTISGDADEVEYEVELAKADYTGYIEVVSDDYIVVDGVIIDLAKEVEVYLVARDKKSVSASELKVDDEREVKVFCDEDGDANCIYIYK